MRDSGEGKIPLESGHTIMGQVLDDCKHNLVGYQGVETRFMLVISLARLLPH